MLIGDGEPLLGTRHEALKAMLKEAYRSPELASKMNKRDASETGRALSDRLTNHLEIQAWMRLPYLTWRQLRVVELYYKHDWSNDEIAKRLGWSRSTVIREKRSALRLLEGKVWESVETPAMIPSPPNP